MTSQADILAAARRSDRAIVEQVSTWEALDFGVAHQSSAFRALADANQLREVWLADADPQAVYNRVESYYAERGLTCLRWTPASSQNPADIERLLVPKGWQRVERRAMGLADGSLAQTPIDPAIRILPARAMPRALRETFIDDGAAGGMLHAAALERLNDPHQDMFVVLLEDRPAGRVGYLNVGDIATVTDLYVCPSVRRRGVGRALVAHCLRLARRLLPNSLVASAESTNDAGLRALRAYGFADAGTVAHFTRPGA